MPRTKNQELAQKAGPDSNFAEADFTARCEKLETDPAFRRLVDRYVTEIFNTSAADQMPRASSAAVINYR